MLVKEFVQMRRDRLTFAMMVGIPIMQLILFGFAINTDPKTLPTAVLDADPSVFARSFVRAMENSGYFRVVRQLGATRTPRRRLLAPGEVQFVLTFRENFSRKLLRGERPVLLVEADATDPAATSNALAALLQRSTRPRSTATCAARWRTCGHGPPPFELRVQRRYNPEGITQYNIVPGPDRRGADDDDGDDDRARDDARARARHDGEPARHAGAADRGDGRQDRARTSSSATCR